MRSVNSAQNSAKARLHAIARSRRAIAEAVVHPNGLGPRLTARGYTSLRVAMEAAEPASQTISQQCRIKIKASSNLGIVNARDERFKTH